MLLESNHIIAANETLVSSQGRQSTIMEGNINPENDVDLYQFQLDAGEGITLDLDAAELDSNLDSALRLFDAEGNELGMSDDNPAPGELFSLDSYLTFIANTSGNYYVGVSSISNQNYNPWEIEPDSNDLDDDTSRIYQLELNIVDVIAEPDPDDTLAEAIITGLNAPGDAVTFSDEIDIGQDIDIYQVELGVGEGLIADIDAAEFDSSLDSQLRLFDASGNELANNDDSSAPEESFSSDSYLTYSAETDGEYFIGVSTAENPNYDPINGRTNLSQNSSTNNGSYDLNIEILSIESDSDPDNTISEANPVEIVVGSELFGSVRIEDTIDIQGDVDVFELYVDEGQTITIDLNAATLNTGLDSALILFDSSGNEIAQNDDGAAPGEDFGTIDSYLEFTADIPGTYYLGISGFPNIDYDIINGSDNLGFNQETFSIGSYELIINSFETIIGTNDANLLWGNATSTLIQGLQGDDQIIGGGIADYLLGDSGNDLLSGNYGNDILIGGTGYDSLSGGEGADILQGDNGNNQLTGGEGADIFVLNETYPHREDTIIDFEDGIDKILLANNSKLIELEIIEHPEGTGITLMTADDNTIAHILGMSQSDFSEDDFIIESNSSEI